MDKEQMETLQAKFAEAYAWRADASDIDWKEMGYGKKLAYLSWAVAWRKFKEFYPDANYRLIETPEGSPLWNVNGFGMLKCAVSALGVEHVENFPVMDNKNASIAISDIDGRDVNDSMQRGLTKAIARFGVGLYIFEGKVDEPKAKPAPKPQQAQRTPQAPDDIPNQATIAYLDKLLSAHGVGRESFKNLYGFDAYETVANARKCKKMFDEMNQGENQ